MGPNLLTMSFAPPVLPVLYSAQECSSAESLEILAIGMSVAAYVVMAFGVSSLSNKIIGVELFGVLQLAYFNLADHFSSVDLMLLPLAKLSISNGPNLRLFA